MNILIIYTIESRIRS